MGAKYVWKKYGDMREFIKIQEMQEILEFLTEIPVDSSVVNRASDLKARLMTKGLHVPDICILIACSDENAEILTFDGDFEALKDAGFNITLLGT